MFDPNLISDEDMDFLCDTAIEVIYAHSDFIDMDPAVKGQSRLIIEYLHDENYDRNIAADIPHSEWWQDCDELEDLFTDEEEGEEKKEYIELSLTAAKICGSRAGENVTVAALLYPVNADGSINRGERPELTIQWLPELMAAQ